MPWCPKCGAEYVENVRKCKDCGVGLLDHKPTSDEMLPPDPKPTGWRRFCHKRTIPARAENADRHSAGAGGCAVAARITVNVL